MIGVSSAASPNASFAKIFPIIPASRQRSDGETIHGTLTIRLSRHSVFLLAFTSDSGCGSDDVSCDIEDAVFPSESESSGNKDPRPMVQIDTPRGLVSIFLEHAADVPFIKEIVDACREVFSLSLRMNSLFRDCFYSGVDMSSVRGVVVNPETVSRASARVLDSVESLAVLKPKSGGARAPGLAASKSKSPTAGGANALPLKCFFCLEVAKRPNDPNFPVHPYVTQDNKGAKIHMCARCVGTWKKYRDDAIANNKLFDGEPNEELCALCSAVPDELILCATCPRSYCSVCLSLVIGHEEFKSMKQQDDWSCMMCSSNSKKSRRSIERTQGASAAMALPSPTAVAAASSSKSEATAMKSQQVVSRSVPPQSVVGQGLGRERKRRRSDRPEAPTPESSPVSGSKSFGVASPIASTQSASRSQDASPVSLPPVDSEHDELYYFGQYISVIRHTTNLFDPSRCVPRDLICQPAILAAPKSAPLTDDLKLVQGRMFKMAPPCCNVMLAQESEDFCTLCKDGGDLIECDFEHKIFDDRMLLEDDDVSDTSRIGPHKGGLTRKGGHHKNFIKRKCRKVYHNYCLGYEVNVDKWFCPTHFCAVCGSASPIIECTLCSISLCVQCAGSWSEQLPLGPSKDLYLLVGRSSEYHGPSNFPAAPNAAHILISCPSCTENVRKCVNRNEVDESDFRTFLRSTVRSLRQDLSSAPAAATAAAVARTSAPASAPERTERPQAQLAPHHNQQQQHFSHPPQAAQSVRQFHQLQSEQPRPPKPVPAPQHSQPQMLPRIELISRQSVPQALASAPASNVVAPSTLKQSDGRTLLLKWNIDDVAIMAEAIENADKSLSKDQLMRILLETEPTKSHLSNYSLDMIVRKVDQFLEHPDMLGAMRRLRESCRQRMTAPPSAERVSQPAAPQLQLSATSSGPTIRALHLARAN